MKLSPERVVLDTNNAHEHGHGVGDHLYVHRHSLVHDLPAQVKTVAAIVFIFVVVLTPVHAVGALRFIWDLSSLWSRLLTYHFR